MSAPPTTHDDADAILDYDAIRDTIREDWPNRAPREAA